MALMKIGGCGTGRSQAILRAVRAQGAHTFNPSVRSHEGDIVVAVRVSDAAIAPVRASLVVLDGESLAIRDGTQADLTAIGAEHGISPVADPKLFAYRGRIWATFNTGFVRTGNDVYVMPVYPEIGEPIRCEAPERQRTEKNWGFFEGEDGDLRAIYMLDPLTVLSFGVVEVSTAPVALRGEVVSRIPNPACAHLTIGTQPVRDDDGVLLIAHQRIGVQNWRGYFGRVVRLRLGEESASADVNARRLIHNARTMLGTRPRRNKHLWFATYFSGLDLGADGSVLLSYGINDQQPGVVEIPRHAL